MFRAPVISVVTFLVVGFVVSHYLVVSHYADRIVSAQIPAFSTGRALVTLTGTDSAVKTQSYRLLRDEKHWVQVWQQHKGLPVTGKYSRTHNSIGLPVIDFERCMVVAVFAGESAQTPSLSVQEVSESEGEVVVRFVKNGYSIDHGRYEPGKEIRVPPALPLYGFFVMPRSDKALVLEEGSRKGRGKPLDWTERQRFAPFGPNPGQGR